MQVYFDRFSNKDDVWRNFNIKPLDLEWCEIIFATYSYANYEGWAQVLFTKDGELYEVVGSHCSCRALEGQWNPEKSNVAALLSRPNISNAAKNNLKIYYKNVLCFL